MSTLTPINYGDLKIMVTQYTDNGNTALIVFNPENNADSRVITINTGMRLARHLIVLKDDEQAKQMMRAGYIQHTAVSAIQFAGKAVKVWRTHGALYQRISKACTKERREMYKLEAQA